MLRKCSYLYKDSNSIRRYLGSLFDVDPQEGSSCVLPQSSFGSVHQRSDLLPSWTDPHQVQLSKELEFRSL